MCTGSTAVFGSLRNVGKYLKTNTASFDLVAANAATDALEGGNDHRQQQRSPSAVFRSCYWRLFAFLGEFMRILANYDFSRLFARGPLGRAGWGGGRGRSVSGSRAAFPARAVPAHLMNI